MGSGWSDLVRIPFFSFLPNVMLGLGFLYVLQWTGVISCWNQLFEPIYEIGPEWAVPSWLIALFILLVLFVIGEIVATFSDALTLIPFLPSDWSKHIYLFDYSNSQENGPHKFPVTERYTPSKKYGVTTEVLWHLFKDERIAEISERDYAIKGRLYSGLFMLSVVYLGLFLGSLIKHNFVYLFLLVPVIVVLFLVIVYQRVLHFFMTCSYLRLLPPAAGIVWLCLWHISQNSKPELIVRTFFVALLAIKFYTGAISERIYANALNYTHYWKIKEEETRKNRDVKNQKSESPEDVQR